MEYALPMGVILIACGVLATSQEVRDLMSDYFLSASGHTRAQLSGGIFNARPVGTVPMSAVSGNGFGGFTSYGNMLDGNGALVRASSGGVFFTSPVSRKGARPAPTSPEYLYP